MQTHTEQGHGVPWLPDVARKLAMCDSMERQGHSGIAGMVRSRMYRKMASVRNARRAEQGDVWHALVETETGRVVKFAPMEEAEAIRRNPTIADLGMAWVRRQPPQRA